MPDTQVINDATQYAIHLSENTVAPYTHSTLELGLKMADLLRDLNCDDNTIAAAIAYPSITYAQPNPEKSKQQLGINVWKLIQGAKRMESIHEIHRNPHDLNPDQSDQLRKMLLAIVDDIRIVMIKLAERLITLQDLKCAKPAQQRHIAKQCMTFYAPLANRLGIGQLKWQLEDLSLRYIEPEQYFNISKALKMRRDDREHFIENMMAALQRLISEADIQDFSISGRAKHIYSIYKKAHRKDVPVSEIYDASALRILVNNVDDCYTALSLVHSTWPHIQKEFDDYIANPKPNGYQSIHTAVVAENARNVEIQIRTYQMHEASELGVAAHWKYKEGSSNENTYEKKIARLRELMDWQQEISDSDNKEGLYETLFADRIYVFTPAGDVFDLPSGATPLDFAYHIHSAIGNRCKGAKVNDKMVQLTHALQTGDRIEIVTSKSAKPSRDWLNAKLGYLITSTARQKVRHWFKRENYQNDLSKGQELFDKTTKHEDIHKSDIQLVTRQLNFKKIDDVLAALGSGQITIASLIIQIKNQKRQKTESNRVFNTEPVTPSKYKQSPLMIAGVGNLLTQLAGCCKPIPGDVILGYITKGRGVTIHQKSCPNIAHTLLTKPERIIEVNWESDQKTGQFPVDLVLQCDDRPGLVRDISNLIMQEKITVLGLNTRLNKQRQQARIYLTVEVKDSLGMQRLMNQLQQVSSVSYVKRL